MIQRNKLKFTHIICNSNTRLANQEMKHGMCPNNTQNTHKNYVVCRCIWFGRRKQSFHYRWRDSNNECGDFRPNKPERWFRSIMSSKLTLILRDCKQTNGSLFEVQCQYIQWLYPIKQWSQLGATITIFWLHSFGMTKQKEMKDSHHWSDSVGMRTLTEGTTLRRNALQCSKENIQKGCI